MAEQRRSVLTPAERVRCLRSAHPRVDGPVGHCSRCLQNWPCDTIMALDAAAAAERDRITAELKACLAGFFGHYGNNSAPSLNLARDLAEGIRQILDKKPMEAQERSDEKEADRG